MFIALIKWWYFKGWPQAWRDIPNLLGRVQRTFSVGLLLRTLFSPWKQITSAGGPSLHDKFDALLDNLVSRTIGMVIRSFVIFAGMVSLAAAMVWGLALAICWPFLPAAIVFLIYKGFSG